MSKDRRTFVFNVDWIDDMEDLDKETRLKFFDAILAYAKNGETPSNMNSIEMVVFKGIKRDIDRNNDKFDETKKKKSEAGKKGNEKRWKSQPIANLANATDATIEIANHRKPSQTIANIAEYEYEYEYENVPHNNGGVIIPAPAREENPENSSLSEKARAFVEFFNEKVHGTCIPQVKKMTEKREITIGRILHTMGRETMEDVIIKATSPSCILATENRGVGIDWFTKEDNVIKVIEGNYDNTRTSSQGSGLCKQETRHLQQLRELAGDDPERYAILEATYKNRG